MKNNDLTIGIPVFNEENNIERTIRSAASQCKTLIVSDNASTDNTGLICKKLANEFDNIRYIRQEENIGSLNNIIYIANTADTQYVMILGAHDHIDQDYTDNILPLIQKNKDAECVMGNLYFFDDDHEKAIADKRFNEWRGGENSKPSDRIWSFFTEGGSSVWATYGIFRTKTFRKYFTNELPLFGPDSIFIASVLLSGKLIISSASRYLAHARKKEKNKSAYFERITGTAGSENNTNRRINEYKTRQYGIIKALHPNDPPLMSLYRRFLCMARFKPFKTRDTDIIYILLYVPAIIANRTERSLRKLLRKL